MTLNTEEREAALSILTRMLSLLGLAAELVVEENGEQTVVSLKSEDPGRLIGRRGRVIENLEYLLNRALSQRFEGAISVGIDVDGYQGRTVPAEGRRSSRKEGGGKSDSVQEEQYRKMAIDAAKEVRRWGVSKELGPFNPRERRVIHLTLADDPEVETESKQVSEGGEKKKVVIRAIDQK